MKRREHIHAVQLFCISELSSSSSSFSSILNFVLYTLCDDTKLPWGYFLSSNF